MHIPAPHRTASARCDDVCAFTMHTRVHAARSARRDNTRAVCPLHCTRGSSCGHRTLPCQGRKCATRLKAHVVIGMSSKHLRACERNVRTHRHTRMCLVQSLLMRSASQTASAMQDCTPLPTLSVIEGHPGREAGSQSQGTLRVRPVAGVTATSGAVDVYLETNDEVHLTMVFSCGCAGGCRVFGQYDDTERS